MCLCINHQSNFVVIAVLLSFKVKPLLFFYEKKIVLQFCMFYFTLIPNLCRIAALMDKTAGGAHRGIPRADNMAGLKMSHNGRQRFSPNSPETVQARQGQHQKP